MRLAKAYDSSVLIETHRIIMVGKPHCTCLEYVCWYSAAFTRLSNKASSPIRNTRGVFVLAAGHHKRDGFHPLHLPGKISLLQISHFVNVMNLPYECYNVLNLQCEQFHGP